MIDEENKTKEEEANTNDLSDNKQKRKEDDDSSSQSSKEDDEQSIKSINDESDEEKKENQKRKNDLLDNEDFKRLKEELDKGNNFIDYFLVIGIDPEISLNEWLYQSDLQELETKYNEILIPKIISYFPPFEKQSLAVDGSILYHCFPNGFKLIKSKTRPKPKTFSFILDDSHFNLNKIHKFITCFLFYENIIQYRVIYEHKKKVDESIKDGNSKDLQEAADVNYYQSEFDISSDLVKDPYIYIPKCIVTMSANPFFSENEKILKEFFNYSLHISYEKKRDNSERCAYLDLEAKQKKATRYIYEPIEKVIENLLIELPFPPKGFSKIVYVLNNEEREIKQNMMNQLPLVDVNFKRLFIDLKPSEIIELYCHLLLESRIIFFSSDIELLNIYIYGILSFLYPLQYQYQKVTILLEENFELLDSLTPFVAGINQKFEVDFFEKKGINQSNLIVVVDIDKRKIVLINKKGQYPKFPEKYFKSLEAKLTEIIEKYMKNELAEVNSLRELENEKNNLNINNNMIGRVGRAATLIEQPKQKLGMNLLNQNEEEINNKKEKIFEFFGNFYIDYNFNYEIQEQFFDFNANLLINYNKYLNQGFYSSKVIPCIDTLFNVEDFLKDKPESEKAFYNKLVNETQIFSDFLFIRMIPNSINDKIRLLLFDEKINDKSNFFKEENVFTNTNEYNFTQIYRVQDIRKTNKKENDYYSDIDNRKQLLSHGIIIGQNKGNNKFIFVYPIFPKLTTKLIFKFGIKSYFPPENWNTISDTKNNEIIAISHLSNVPIKKTESTNFINICWLQMWAMTFWYCDEEEQNYRFQEMLKIIDKTPYCEMETINLLFECLINYSKDEKMVLKLYDLLLKIHLNLSQKLHKLIFDIIDKKNVEGSLHEKLQKILKNEKKETEKEEYNTEGFRKRILRAKYFENILTENITFYAYDCCIMCHKIINLETACLNYQNMEKELTWVKCPVCQTPMLPKLSIQFGKEINKTGDLEINTCNYESVVLFSPYFLKTNYDSMLIKNFGCKLDVVEFMIKYREIFWNSLWYYKLNGLGYDFFIPYQLDYKKVLQNDNIEISFK